MQEKNVKVFLGPSLDPDKAKKILNIEYNPPAQRGDIRNTINQGKELICLIDGVFHQNCSVAHREILEALKNDIEVIGASSMGALRASELDEFGMKGIGKIYQWYKKGKINSDDEVAVVFETETYQTLSEPLVNIRYNLERAKNKGIVTRNEFNKLIETAKSLHYPKRNYGKIFSIAEEEKKIDLEEIKRYIKNEKIDLKEKDAIKALKEIKKRL